MLTYYQVFGSWKKSMQGLYTTCNYQAMKSYQHNKTLGLFLIFLTILDFIFTSMLYNTFNMLANALNEIEVKWTKTEYWHWKSCWYCPTGTVLQPPHISVCWHSLLYLSSLLLWPNNWLTLGHCDITADTSQPGRSWVWSDLEKAQSYKTWKSRNQRAVESSRVAPHFDHILEDEKKKVIRIL